MSNSQTNNSDEASTNDELAKMEKINSNKINLNSTAPIKSTNTSTQSKYNITSKHPKNDLKKILIKDIDYDLQNDQIKLFKELNKLQVPIK